MQVMQKGDIPHLQPDELSWCREHLDVPQAALIVALHDDAQRGMKPPDELIRDALVELRKVNPRTPWKVGEFFAWVFFNPANQSEAIPGILDATGMPSMLMGCDMIHMRSLLPHARAVKAQVGSELKLYRYAFDRMIPPEKIPHIRPQNIKTRTAQELFAYVGPAPSGDETVMGYLNKTKGNMVMMAHPDGEEIIKMAPVAKTIRASGQPIELRRFVRAHAVTDKAFQV